MSRLFNNEYFNELEELGEMTTEESITNFKSRIGLSRYEILDITGQKQNNFINNKGKFDMSKCINTNAIDKLNNKDLEKALKILNKIK